MSQYGQDKTLDTSKLPVDFKDVTIFPHSRRLSGCPGVLHGCQLTIIEEKITPTRDFPVDETCDT